MKVLFKGLSFIKEISCNLLSLSEKTICISPLTIFTTHPSYISSFICIQTSSNCLSVDKSF